MRVCGGSSVATANYGKWLSIAAPGLGHGADSQRSSSKLFYGTGGKPCYDEFVTRGAAGPAPNGSDEVSPCPIVRLSWSPRPVSAGK